MLVSPTGRARVVAWPLAAATALAGVALAVLPASSAYADDASIAQQFVASINAARAANGLPAYSVASDLASIAQNWSAQMAAAGSISHNPGLTTEVPNWQEVGENVGMGPDEPAINQAFLNSPEHRANILDTGYTQVGVGVTVSNGTVFVVEDFRLPMSASAPAPAPAPAPPAPVAAPVSVSAPVAAPTHAAVPTTTAAHPAATHPAAPRPTAAQRLWQRLSALRTFAEQDTSTDPVTRALAYAHLMATLTG